METTEKMEAVVENMAAEVERTTENDNINAAQADDIKMVYIGPSIPRSKLRNGQILSGTEAEIMEFVGEMSERYAEIKYLLVEPKRLSEAQKQVRESGNILHKYYQDMAAKARTSRGRVK